MRRNFGKILRDELDYQGLTVKELAQKSLVAKGALDSYLGKQASMPPADTAVRIAAVLGVTVEYLVNGRDDASEKNVPFYSNPGKRALLRLFDELPSEEQNLTLDFVKLLKKRRKDYETHLIIDNAEFTKNDRRKICSLPSKKR
jgi:transcriptional regulator with XRE-family HTH domain